MIHYIVIFSINTCISFWMTKMIYACQYTYYLELLKPRKPSGAVAQLKIFKRKKFIQAGMTMKERKIYCIIEIICPLIICIVGFKTPLKALSMVLLIILVVESNLIKRINNRKLIFKENGYKIYRFLFNQISSGVRINDAIKNIYEVVEHPELKNNLIKFSALYTQTLNIDLALDFLKTNYTGIDINNLSMAIKQGIRTGDNLDIIKRQEELMFHKYISYIRLITDLKKKYYLIIVLMFTIIIVLMISIPIIMNLLSTTETIFI